MALTKETRLNFGWGAFPEVGWQLVDNSYNLATHPALDLLDPDDDPTGWQYQTTKSFAMGGTTNTEGLYSNNITESALRQGFATDPAAPDGDSEFKITGLDPTLTYTAIASYIIDGTTAQVQYTIPQAQTNQSQIIDNDGAGALTSPVDEAFWNDIVPNAQGEIFVEVIVVVGTNQRGRISGFILKEYDLTPPPPGGDVELDANWTQTSSNVKHPFTEGGIVRQTGTVTFTPNYDAADEYLWEIYNYTTNVSQVEKTFAVGDFTYQFNTLGDYAVKLTMIVANKAQSVIKEYCVKVVPALPPENEITDIDLATTATETKQYNFGNNLSGVWLDLTNIPTNKCIRLTGNINNRYLILHGLNGTELDPYLIINDANGVILNRTGTNNALLKMADCSNIYIDGYGTDVETNKDTRNKAGLGFHLNRVERGRCIEMDGDFAQHNLQNNAHFYGCNLVGANIGFQYFPDYFSAGRLWSDYLVHNENFHITHNYFYNCKSEGIYFGYNTGLSVGNIDSVKSAGFEKLVIAHNMFDYIGMDPVQVAWCPNGNANIAYNDFYDTSTAELYDFYQPHNWHSSVVSLNSGFGGRVFCNYVNKHWGGVVSSNSAMHSVYYYSNVFLNMHHDVDSNGQLYYINAKDTTPFDTAGIVYSISNYIYNNTFQAYKMTDSSLIRTSSESDIDNLRIHNNLFIAPQNLTGTTITRITNNTTETGNVYIDPTQINTLDMQYVGLNPDNLIFPYPDVIRAGLKSSSILLTGGEDLNTLPIGDAPNTGIFPTWHDTYRDFIGYYTPTGQTDWMIGARVSPAETVVRPVAIIVSDKTTAGIYETITLDATSSLNAISYAWDFGTTDFAFISGDINSSIVQIQYTAIGTFTISLTIADAAAVEDVSTLQIVVAVQSPTAKTPIYYRIWSITSSKWITAIVNDYNEIDPNTAPDGSGDVVEPTSVQTLSHYETTNDLDKLATFSTNTEAKGVLKIGDLYWNDTGQLSKVY